MPHNKGHNQSKKKGKIKGSHSKQPASSNPSRQGPSLLPPNAFAPKTPDDSTTVSSGYHAMYKEATLRFHNWMSQKACPKSKMTAVNDYRKGVDLIANHNMSVYLNKNDEKVENLIVTPPEIMASLASSIRLREKVTASLFGSKSGGDLGHQYIIDVLHYCRSTLRFGNRIAAIYQESMGEKVADAIGGRFSALTLDDDDEEEELEWDDIDQAIREGNLPKYTGVEVEEEMDISEILLKGDDRLQAMFLLYTMNDSMAAVHMHYKHFKSYLRGNSKFQGSSCMHLLMKCAVVANAATESVHQAENELGINHPHLASFYHVLVLVFMTEIMAEVEKFIDKNWLKKTPHMVLQFLAEIVESSFHYPGQTRIPSIVKRFIAKSGLDPMYVEETAQATYTLISYETTLKVEERLNPGQTAHLAGCGLDPHSWLNFSEFIGGRLLLIKHQKVGAKTMDLLQDDQKFDGRPGFWGQSFDENKNPARCIRGDLDEALVSSILPDLLKFADQHLKGDRTKPLPIGLSFGLHAVLISILVLQGDGDLTRIAAYSKKSYNRLFEQLQALSDQSKPPSNSPNFYHQVSRFAQLAGLAKPYDVNIGNYRRADPVAAAKNAFWNPLIGGEYMLYATYMCSIGLGSATVDTLVRILDPAFEVPFLEKIDKVFSNTKAVWVGGKPGKGSCSKVFWMSFGLSAKRASKIYSEYAALKHAFPVNPQGDDLRILDEIDPGEFSTSYRCLIQQAFGAENFKVISSKHRTSEETEEAEQRCLSLMDLLIRADVTHKAMDDEKDVLPLNFTAIGTILLEFVNALSDHTKWSTVAQGVLQDNPTILSGQTAKGTKMRGFTASELNFKSHVLTDIWGYLLWCIDTDYTEHSFLPVFDVKDIATFTKSFFGKIEKSRYTFFADSY